MKKVLIPMILMIVSVFTINTTFAQNSFEGKITYGIVYNKVPAMLQGYESMLPSETFIYMKGHKIRTEVPMAMGGNQVVIFDKDAFEGVMLMDILGQKMAVKLEKDAILKEEAKQKKPKITYFNDYKTIAGYKCQKAMVETELADGTSEAVTLYFTEKIPNMTQNFGDLKGIALEYQTNKDGVESVLTAKSVLKQKVPNTLFETPDGYEVTTLDELEGK